jgi:hypothetical protein
MLVATLIAVPASALTTGTPVPPGLYDAVGRLGGCSATLITQTQVLTAAHCVCKDDLPNKCSSRATFELFSVAPADNPATIQNESATLANLSIPGTLRINPEFSFPTWMLNDFAVLDLDFPVYTVAPWVQPIPLELPNVIPRFGETFWIVGHGHTGPDCSGSRAKLWLSLPSSEAENRALRFRYSGYNACPGDSGGAVLNGSGRIVAVISWTGRSGSNQAPNETTSRPVHPSFNWIIGAPRPNWNSCQWVELGPNRSHQRGANWCPAGYFITQFDLDGPRNYSPQDTPVIGRANCCALPYAGPAWGSCGWYPVGAVATLNNTGAWCPQGSYLVQLDLDTANGLSPNNSPIVGQARCCTLGPGAPTNWGSTAWYDVGGARSHQKSAAWCPYGSFLTGLDFVGPLSDHSHDTPYVNRALCVRPRP